ncbi:MAG: type II toxin-antitoxin system VapC family toxin [Nitrospinota bacterium]
MNTYIVDASVSGKWFVKEDHSKAALSLLGKGNQLHAPDFFLLEMDSVFSKWIRRGIVTAGEADDIRAALRECPIRYHPFLTFLDSAYTIANRSRHSIYDCLYIALAVLLKGKMVTADRKFYNVLTKSPFAKYVLWVEDIA